MKKGIFIVALLLSGFAMQTASAQLTKALGVNINSQPVWGPVGYDHVDYYYMPDIDAYYNVPSRKYYYFDRGQWVPSYSLPPAHSNYDVYNGYKVVVNEPYPYRRADVYRVKYAGFKNRHDQIIIRNSDEVKYYQVKGHPKHLKWKAEKGSNHDNRNHDKWKVDTRNNQDNGNHKNKGKGKGRH